MSPCRICFWTVCLHQLRCSVTMYDEAINDTASWLATHKFMMTHVKLPRASSPFPMKGKELPNMACLPTSKMGTGRHAA